MVKFALQFKASLENLTRLRPHGEDFRWFLKLKCGNCGEVSEKWQYITLMPGARPPIGRSASCTVSLRIGQTTGLIQKVERGECVKDSVPLKGGRGSASMVQRCKLCSRENSIDILGTSLQTYNAEDSDTFKTIVEFECRGLEPVNFQPQAGFAAEGAETGTPFTEINLQEKDWTEYDENAKESVGIYEVEHQFKKC